MSMGFLLTTIIKKNVPEYKFTEKKHQRNWGNLLIFCNFFLKPTEVDKPLSNVSNEAKLLID